MADTPRPDWAENWHGSSEWLLTVGTRVRKVTGDYRFEGVVVAAFGKLNGQRRYVVENADGILHIFSGKNLEVTCG